MGDAPDLRDALEVQDQGLGQVDPGRDDGRVPGRELAAAFGQCMLNTLMAILGRQAWLLMVSRRRQSELRRHIGAVPQDPVCFSGTITSNIRLHDESITDEQVRLVMTEGLDLLSQLRSHDPTLPIVKLRSMDQVFSDSAARPAVRSSATGPRR